MLEASDQVIYPDTVSSLCCLSLPKRTRNDGSLMWFLPIDFIRGSPLFVKSDVSGRQDCDHKCHCRLRSRKALQGRLASLSAFRPAVF
jgi:hypothetical protein